MMLTAIERECECWMNIVANPLLIWLCLTSS